MASRLVLQQLGRRVAIGSPATATATASGSGLSAPARAFSSGSTNGPTVASNSQVFFLGSSSISFNSCLYSIYYYCIKVPCSAFAFSIRALYIQILYLVTKSIFPLEMLKLSLLLITFLLMYYICMPTGPWSLHRGKVIPISGNSKAEERSEQHGYSIEPHHKEVITGRCTRHQEPAASSGQVLDALGLGAFYGFLGGFMLHFVISKSQTDNGGSQW